MKSYVAYAGSYSHTGKAKGITIFDVDVERNSFEKRVEVEMDNASDIVVSSNRRMFYAVENYGMVVFHILLDDSLVRASSKKVNDMRPRHIYIDQKGKYPYISDYHDGKPTILRLGPDDAVGPIVDEVYHESLDSTAEHGSGARIICSKPIRGMRFVMSADPDTNQVSIYRSTGRPRETRPVGTIRTACGSSPYFFIFSKDNRFPYLLLDMTSAISVCHYTVSENRGMPKFTKLQTVRTAGDNAPGSLNAVTCMTFTAHDHYIFVDNAGDNGVALFSQDAETGLLTVEFSLLVSDECPKDVAMFPDGQHVVSVNHKGGTLSFFRVDYEEKPTIIDTNEIPVSQPNCCVIVPVGEDM